MYKIGYIDDERTQFENICKKISRIDKELELCWIQGSSNIQDIIEEIYKEQIDVLLIDYKMARTFGFNGSRLISQMNDYIFDLPCFILTQVNEKEIDDGLVQKRDILSKTIFDTEAGDEIRTKELTEKLAMLKDAAIVFRARMAEKVEEYKELLQQKTEGKLKNEAQLKQLYKVLSSYGMVEKLPEEFLSSNIQSQLMKLIEMGQKIISQHEGV